MRTEEHGRATDWDAQWQAEPFDAGAPLTEEETLRWRAQERLIRERFGSFDRLETIELGAGRGLNGFLFASRGAVVTLLDLSPVALEQARRLFAAHDLPAETVQGDVFEPPPALRGRFDVSMSYGLCEHFLGERRQAVITAHLDVLRPGGLALLGVPNRYAPVYRLWVKTLMLRGSWSLGTEVPFSVRELKALAERAGGIPQRPVFGSFLGSVVNHGVNQVLFKVGRRGLRVPQVRLPGFDRLAYELLLPVVKPR